MQGASRTLIHGMTDRLKDIYRYVRSPKVRNPETPDHVRSVLFICKGNICRSPFAEHIARKAARERSWEGFVFSSAGLEVRNPLPSTLEAVTVAGTFGIDLRAHRSNGIAIHSAESQDMIIGMEAWHVQRLRELIPNAQGKIYLLPLFEECGQRRYFSYHRSNIADPYGRPFFQYQECFQRMKKCIEGMFRHIREGGGGETKADGGIQAEFRNN